MTNEYEIDMIKYKGMIIYVARALPQKEPRQPGRYAKLKENKRVWL